MRNKKALQGRKKRYLLLSGIIALVIGVLVWQFAKNNLLHKGLQNAISKKTHNLYQLTYKDLILDEVSGSLSAKDIELMPDPAIYDSLNRAGLAPTVILHLKIPSLSISAFKTPKALISKEISGQSLIIENPEIEILTHKFLKDSTAFRPQKEIYKQILGRFKSIKVDSILINHARIVVEDIESKQVHFKGDDFSIQMTDVLVDSVQKDDSSRLLFAKNLNLSGTSFEIPSSNKEYSFEFKKIGFESRKNSLTLGLFRVSPVLSESAFAAAHHFSKDRFDIKLEGLALDSLDREAMWTKKIIAKSLTWRQGSIRIYRDISHPHDSVNRVGKYPQQLIEKIPIPLMLHRIESGNTYIEYKEKNGKSDTSGRVRFENVQATINNFTNIKSFIARNDALVVHFRSRFLGQTPLIATLNMKLQDKNGRFSVQGHLDQLEAKKINPLIEPMALARLEKGQIDRLDFRLRGDNYRSAGELRILYHDIKINLLKKADRKYKTRPIPTLLGRVLIKRSNPSESDGVPRTADMTYQRDIHRSLFNLIWKSILTGVKKSAGMK